MRLVELKSGNLVLKDKVTGFIEKRVTRYGNGAKVDCPKKFLGKRVYLLVCE